MADNYTVTKNGMNMTKTFDDGTSITVPNPDYNPEPGWGVTVSKPKATAKATPKTTVKATPKATAKATPTPTPTKGTQAGHAITDSKNHTRTVK
jgi:hypothetical protein